jgi:hypothetical protein
MNMELVMIYFLQIHYLIILVLLNVYYTQRIINCIENKFGCDDILDILYKIQIYHHKMLIKLIYR